MKTLVQILAEMKAIPDTDRHVGWIEQHMHADQLLCEAIRYLAAETNHINSVQMATELNNFYNECFSGEINHDQH